MERQFASIHEKLDRLDTDLNEITRRLHRLDELREDMSLIASDAFSSVVDFLSALDSQFDSRDLALLLQKALRNIRGLSALLDQMQGARELLEDLAPLAKEGFADLVERLDRLEREGILSNLIRSGDVLLRLLSAVTPDQIDNLGETARRLTVAAARTPLNTGKGPSLLGILRKARHPAVRRQLDHVLNILIRAEGAETAPPNQTMHEETK